jgi:hypothetical protein
MKPRPLIDWIRDKLRPPDVMPVRRTWAQASGAAFWWVVRMGLIWILNGC